MRRSAIYARQSKDEEGSYSIGTQVEDCRRFAKANDLEVVAVYDKDKGKSGADRKRPDLLRLIDAAQAGEFDVLLVRDTDRLARDAEFALNLSNVLSRVGVSIYPINEAIRDTAGEDRFTYGVFALVAEQERSRTTRRMKRGKKESARAGHYRGGERPYGLKPVPCDRHKDCRWSMLALDEDEADALRQVWSWIVEEGVSGNEAAERLNDTGILPTRRGQPWTRQTLRLIIKNPRMMGKSTSWGVEQDIPAIYSPAEFARLQRALDDWTKRYRNTSGERLAYPLSGRIICGCGAHWIGGARHGKRWYHCSQHPSYANQKDPACDWTVRRWIQSDEIEQAVLESIGEHLFDEQAIWGAVIDYLTENTGDPAELSRARRAVDTYEDKLAVLYGRVTDLDPAAFKKATAKLQEDLTDARHRVDRLEAASVVNLSPEVWQRLEDLNEAKQEVDTTTWSGLVELGRLAGQLTDELRNDLPVDDLVAQTGDWFAAKDLDRLARELDVKVHLTGRQAFRLEVGFDVGPTHIRASLT